VSTTSAIKAFSPGIIKLNFKGILQTSRKMLIL
jgi:hypothetical protein